MNIDPKLIQLSIISSVGAWGVTSAIKPLVWKYLKEAWSKSVVRLAALVAGASFGFAIEQSAEAAIAGLAGGAMSATVVGAIRAIINRRASGDKIEDE